MLIKQIQLIFYRINYHIYTVNVPNLRVILSLNEVKFPKSTIAQVELFTSTAERKVVKI